MHLGPVCYRHGSQFSDVSQLLYLGYLVDLHALLAQKKQSYGGYAGSWPERRPEVRFPAPFTFRVI